MGSGTSAEENEKRERIGKDTLKAGDETIAKELGPLYITERRRKTLKEATRLEKKLHENQPREQTQFRSKTLRQITSMP